MEYVEFYDESSDPRRYLGEIRLDRNRLVISEDLMGHWDRLAAYAVLGRVGYQTMYDPEKILYALPNEFSSPEFHASKVKTRSGYDDGF